jgi:murein DD-endopeptidase MepM/ murein hydrolase activator NlpD
MGRPAAFLLLILTALGCGGRNATPVASSPADRPETPAQAGAKRPAPKPAERIDRPAPPRSATADDTRDADPQPDPERPGDREAAPDEDTEPGRDADTEPGHANGTGSARDDRPTGVVHILRRGQTLYSLARLYDLPIATLIEANGIANTRAIPAGTRIFVPGVTRAVPYRSTRGAGKGDAAERVANAPVATASVVPYGPPAPARPKDAHRTPRGDEAGDRKPGGKEDGDATVEERRASGERNPGRKPGDEHVDDRGRDDTGEHGERADRGQDDHEGRDALSEGSGDRLQWPLRGAITGPYGRRGQHGHHAGIDIDGDRGDAILAAGPGVVVSAGADGEYGRCVEIDHGDGLVTLYAHADKLLVHEGEEVEAGQQIAVVGRSGNARGTHLHFEVRRDGHTIDPMPLLAGNRPQKKDRPQHTRRN